MSRPIVRRLTAAVALVTVLGFAVPVGAAPPDRPHATRTSVVLGSGVLDQFLSWLASLWFGHEPNPQSSQEKTTGTTSTGTDSSTSQDPLLTPLDRGAQIDPNG